MNKEAFYFHMVNNLKKIKIKCLKINKNTGPDLLDIYVMHLFTLNFKLWKVLNLLSIVLNIYDYCCSCKIHERR